MLARVTIATLMLIGGLSASLAGQQPGPVPAGSYVRVTGAGNPTWTQEGRFRAISGDTLILDAPEFTTPFTVTMRSVARIETRVGRFRHTKSVARIGALVGLGVGISSAIAAANNNCGIGPTQNGWDSIRTGFCWGGIVLMPAAMTLGGYGLGALVGHFIVTDTWVDVPLEHVRVSVAPRGHGAGIGLAFSF